ncbi:DUF4870 domain-containing protein [Cellulophaga sp. HaHaR_3_176]|uniref:DUF4870 domain-containing protein n=1 Tax=Cellulophaga sp. HaHaR_3_176 TaxID=1942464 RepID=UPI001C1F5018|nr:DUF4870 domain-containing protein [Cellulophaga sp. HaHaR_3_176]QWX84508.1 DUF4870 domain-containing protein [Cellulophaga sp. HaHaR_3_176]
MKEVSLKYDDSTLALLHYSQLLNFIGFLGIIIPVILWSTKKKEIQGMDEHGKHVINYQLSMLLYVIIYFILFFLSMILTLVLIGYVFIIILCLIGIPLALLLIVYPIIGGIAASKGTLYKYPLTIKFIS